MAVAAIPLILSAAGAATSGVAKANADAYNSSVYGEEATTAATQGYQAEASQRRQNASMMGKQVAALGQAGAGYGGSAGRSVGQSAVNAELDALNIRYKAGLQKWSYSNQSSNLASEGQVEGNQGILRAGAALLKGYSNNYLNPGTDDTLQP